MRSHNLNTLDTLDTLNTCHHYTIPTFLQWPIKCVTVSTGTQLLQLKTAHIVHSCGKSCKTNCNVFCKLIQNYKKYSFNFRVYLDTLLMCSDPQKQRNKRNDIQYITLLIDLNELGFLAVEKYSFSFNVYTFFLYYKN